jgi:hypothetical protein
MKKMKLNFYQCILDSQKFGSTNEHMMSRLFFRIDYTEYVCDIRQPYGSDHSFENDPIEVRVPEKLKEIVNYEQFRQAAEDYYRKSVGAEGSGIKIGEGCTNIRMSNITFVKNYSVEIDQIGFSGGW